MVKPAGVEHSDRFGSHGALTLQIVLDPSSSRKLDGRGSLGPWRWIHGVDPARRMLSVLNEWRGFPHLSQLAERAVFDTLAALEIPEGRVFAPPRWLRRVADSIDDQWADLLPHTHGISSDPIVFRLAFTGQHDPELLQSLLARAEPSEEGRVFDYGNIGYNIATIALDHFLEKSWKEVLRDELFDPLGMASTTAYVSRADTSRLVMPYSIEPGGQVRITYDKEDANMQSAGGLITTVADLAPWLIANLNSGRVNGHQLIPAEAVAIAHRPTAEEDDSYQGFTRTSYSLGWHHGMYRGERFVHHFGGFSGFHAHISFMPERGIGVAVLVNNDGLGSFLATTTAKGIYDILVDGPGVDAHLDSLLADREGDAAELLAGVKEDRARRAARPQELPYTLEAYTGTYRNEDFGTMVWTVNDGALRVDMGVAGSDVEVYDGEKNQLRVELTGGGMVVGFRFDGNRAERLAMRGGDIVFERVK